MSLQSEIGKNDRSTDNVSVLDTFWIRSGVSSLGLICRGTIGKTMPVSLSNSALVTILGAIVLVGAELRLEQPCVSSKNT